jgi:Na+/proline symporter
MAGTLDLVVILAYIVLVLWIGIRAVRREHLEGYLVNNRKTKLFVLTLSNAATLIGAGAVVAVVSAAYTTGISYGVVLLVGLTLTTILLALIAPRIKAFGDTHKAHTVGDFFEHRFGKKARTVFAVLYVLLAVVWGGIQFVALALLVKVLIGVSFLIALIGAAIVTIIYTSLAGIISDILTDFIQFWVMLLMYLVLVPIAWSRAGGLSALQALPSSYYDPLAFGGAAFLIGGIFLAGLVLLPSVHYWQRIYSADSVSTARKGFIWAIPWMIFFSFAGILIGLFAVSLVPGVDPDSAMFVLMDKLLPPGLLGFGFAGIIAVLMSSVDSLLIGGSATILKDIYMPFFHPKMHEHELLNMARYISAVFGLVIVGLAFFLPDVVKLSILAASTALCFVPSIIGGIFWKRTTGKASIWSMILSIITLYALFPFLPKAAFLPAFFVATITLIVISFLTKNPKTTLRVL